MLSTPNVKFFALVRIYSVTKKKKFKKIESFTCLSISSLFIDMIHWQTYYQQNKHLPIHVIMEGYNRILNEFNERLLITQQNTPNGSGPGGRSTSATAYLVYTPSSQLLEWYDSVVSYNNVSLSEFQTVPNDSVKRIDILLNSNNITSINGLQYYQNLENINIEYQSISLLDISNMPNLYQTNTNYLVDVTSLTIKCSSNTTQAWGPQGGGCYVLFNPNLTTINLEGYNQNLEFTANSNPSLTTINFNDCQSLAVFVFQNALTSIDLSNDHNLTTLSCEQNAITTIALSPSASVISLTANDNLLSQQEVDDLLIYLDNNGLTFGNVNLAGTGNAARSSASDTAVSSLVSKNWTVVTN